MLRTSRGRAALDLGPTGPRDRGPQRPDDLLGPPECGHAKGGYRWRRQRHSLKGRQEADAVDRAGLRLRLLKQQAAAGDIRLLFGDKSEALTHPYLAHRWAKRGADLRVEAPGQARKRALLGVLDHAGGELIVITSASKRSGDFADLLACLDRRYGPKARPGEPAGGAGARQGPDPHQQGHREALAARPWLTVEWLPK